jgi:UDP-glucuronate 4-epimerase
MRKVLVTGAAGFIGMHLTEALLKRGDFVVGVDNLSDYYDPALKRARLNKISLNSNASHFEFIKADLAKQEEVDFFFKNHTYDLIVHLAAQAGVRYSLLSPRTYIDSNVSGFMNILEGARSQWGNGIEAGNSQLRHLVYASSSSVYGGNIKLPFSECDSVDHPASLYAATKKSNELMAYSYSHLFKIPCSGLRFFTVYGPWGRPDMALFLFVKAILSGSPIPLFNYGKMLRDYTYVDDVVESIIKVADIPPKPILSAGNSSFDIIPPHRILNVGNHKPEPLTEFINAIEDSLGISAHIDLQPMQPGDVPSTYANIDCLRELINFEPKTSIREGIDLFVRWYRNYYKE